MAEVLRKFTSVPQFDAAVTGIGQTAYTKASGRSVLSLADEACRNAIADAGLTPADIDGVGSFMVMHDSVPSVAVASSLGLPGMGWSVDLDLGGQAPCHLVAQAAAAVHTKQARHVVVFRAMNGRSGPRVGTMQFHGGGAGYRYPIGYDAYLMYVAMWGQRFLHETGQGELDLGAVAVAQRAHAQRNRAAFRREPLTLDDYLAQPFVVEPFRGADCTVEVDGACAVVVSALDRARDLPNPPAVIASGGYRSGPRPGLDIGDHLLWDDYTRNYTSLLRDELYGRAGISVADLDFAQIYDCFTSTVLIGIEGLGIAERGGSGEFVRSGATALDGRLPINTHGGLLSEGYLHGMNTVVEAVRQLQGRAGDRQIPRHEVGVVTSGAQMDGSAMVLTADR